MKASLRTALMVAWFLAPGTALGQEAVGAAPPLQQALVAEGYFATQLAEALKVGTPGSDAEAESLLAAIGIVPKNGWISAYPVTPEVVTELRDSIEAATSSGELKMSTDDAEAALENVVKAELGVDITAQGPDQYPVGDESGYAGPSSVNDYDAGQGPPVVSYYQPPPDYSYLYGWVPSPFWCNGAFFPGFFLLSDFDVVVVHHRHRHGEDRDDHFEDRHHERGETHRGRDGDRFEVTNHVIDSRTRAVSVVGPRGREPTGTNAAPRMSWIPGKNPVREGSVKAPAPVTKWVWSGQMQSAPSRTLPPQPSEPKVAPVRRWVLGDGEPYSTPAQRPSVAAGHRFTERPAVPVAAPAEGVGGSFGAEGAGRRAYAAPAGRSYEPPPRRVGAPQFQLSPWGTRGVCTGRC